MGTRLVFHVPLCGFDPASLDTVPRLSTVEAPTVVPAPESTNMLVEPLQVLIVTPKTVTIWPPLLVPLSAIVWFPDRIAPEAFRKLCSHYGYERRSKDEQDAFAAFHIAVVKDLERIVKGNRKAEDEDPVHVVFRVLEISGLVRIKQTPNKVN